MDNKYELELSKLVLKQLNNFWSVKPGNGWKKAVFNAHLAVCKNLCSSGNERCYSSRKQLDISYSGQYTLFLYYLSRELNRGCDKRADYVYYLNKIMHGVDWYHEIKLPVHFGIEHPVGSVLGKAEYGCGEYKLS